MIHISALNIRDFTYVFANMRERDKDELYCQLPEGTNQIQAQQIVKHSIAGLAFSASDSTGPIACFGAAESGIPHIYIGWAFGTKRFYRAAPSIKTFMWDHMAPALVDAGCKRLEVRAKQDYAQVTNWLPKLGFHLDGTLSHWARTGENFHLYSLTMRDYNNRNKRVN